MLSLASYPPKSYRTKRPEMLVTTHKSLIGLVRLLLGVFSLMLIISLTAQVTVYSDVALTTTVGTYSNIQDAINGATTLDGHLVVADASTHAEAVVVDKSLPLIGQRYGDTSTSGGVYHIAGTALDADTSKRLFLSNTQVRKGFSPSPLFQSIKYVPVFSCFALRTV